ncbi:hypothetical protein Niako_3398 [Niastella koreensis GR20-10]|uniref:N-acetyltransferase domain-containing protein n=1 Tax=Niastella koreensis (strain DSM 17620 / KACC 11465 / NBRC 106392 / GR20-10) TaxID=700598 RepID=G8TJG9_NIAKG|nr:hypothetical protein [Niastella koreensis]AEV99704.1 hypothetical protein Niako_3398 [Niastella koreensis GR20-10]
MKTSIEQPKNIPAGLKTQLIDFIASGSQVDRHFVERGIPRAALISITFDQDVIACTATIKNPVNSYREGVFTDAKVDKLLNMYRLELGYIVTRKEYEGNKLCQNLLSHLMPKVAKENIFATTKKPEMIHILKKVRVLNHRRRI